jgi:hypothetical protein
MFSILNDNNKMYDVIKKNKKRVRLNRNTNMFQKNGNKIEKLRDSTLKHITCATNLLVKINQFYDTFNEESNNICSNTFNALIIKYNNICINNKLYYDKNQYIEMAKVKTIQFNIIKYITKSQELLKDINIAFSNMSLLQNRFDSIFTITASTLVPSHDSFDIITLDWRFNDSGFDR